MEAGRGAVVVRVVDQVADRVRSSHRPGRVRVGAEGIDDDLLGALDLGSAERTTSTTFGVLVKKPPNSLGLLY